MLRHRDTRLPAPLKARYKACLHRHLPDLVFPSVEEETQNTIAADEIYEAAGAWLLTQTRNGKRFWLLFEENVNFGFRRNFRGMKPVALVVSTASFVFSLGVAWARYKRVGDMPPLEANIATGLVAVYILFVVVRANSAWVRIPAEALGRQLLATCDSLPAKAARGRKTRTGDAATPSSPTG